jgi:hypothetical protein
MRDGRERESHESAMMCSWPVHSCSGKEKMMCSEEIEKMREESEEKRREERRGEEKRREERKETKFAVTEAGVCGDGTATDAIVSLGGC